MIRALTVLLLLACATVTQAAVYPAPAGGGSRVLTVYSNIDESAAAPLVHGYQRRYPRVRVNYRELGSIELYNHFLAENEGGHPVADLLLSSAMDLQLKLVNDGYARRLEPPSAASLPNWAVWHNEAFGFTFEPAVMVFNRERMPAGDVPATRADLARLLREQPERYFGRVATYDPERAGLGFLFATQDARRSRDFWTLVRRLGASGVKLYSTTAAILDRIANGKFLIGYNLLGSYARARATADPALGIVYPADYTLVLSRIAIVPRSAPHPVAGAEFLDFLLSADGQRIIAGAAQLYSLLPEVSGSATAAELRARVGANLVPIRVGPGLLVYLDQAKRQRFLRRWQRALKGR